MLLPLMLVKSCVMCSRKQHRLQLITVMEDSARTGFVCHLIITRWLLGRDDVLLTRAAFRFSAGHWKALLT